MMQTPLEIDFQGMAASPEVHDKVAKHVAALEQRFDRVTACRVIVKAPGGHHQSGGLYEINIHLGLPDGREVNIARTPRKDERHSDLNFALHDAFKRARRQLQDYARRLQGQVKAHDDPAIATVARLDPAGQFGFLTTADGRSDMLFRRGSDGLLSMYLMHGFQVLTFQFVGNIGLEWNACYGQPPLVAAR